ncbi:hypothetical protein C1X05_14760 [Laceyella sacchari]|uniref:Uncharacterized nucleotidyltransferase n=1 Tax=Laceyella tengchongensis TaxID=574699 RepID=A0AA46AFW6_9BACL|nr:nucleotidyltransferase family protein [Laceyella tengchongensis]AUS09961.1 hypothetical protein C1X05_14760 [Laceyella sacchari]SMP22564.1 Uncharacterised nucleotidyltransferase [Laceyella tengchongensis]
MAIQDLLLLTGRLTEVHGDSIEALLATFSERDLMAFTELVIVHRVVPQVIKKLNRQFSLELANINAKKIKEALLPHWTDVQRWIRIHDQAMEELIDIHKVFHPLVIKGGYLQSLYEVDSPRMISDLDLVIDHQQIWDYLGSLQRKGYHLKKARLGRYAIYRDNPNYPKFVGVCPMWKESEDDIVEIDIHVGAFPSCGEGLILFKDTDLHIKRSVYYPTAEKSILILLAHIVRHGFCRLRDINDFYLLWNKPGLDKQMVEDATKDEYLYSVLQHIRQLTGQVYSEFPLYKKITEDPMLFAVQNEKDRVRDRIMQFRYLSQLYSSYFGEKIGLLKAVKTIPYLERTNRPYPIWEHRKTNGMDDERMVFVPLYWYQGDIRDDVIQILDSDQIEVYPEFQAVVVSPGKEQELIIVPNFILTSTSYRPNYSLLPKQDDQVKALFNQFGVGEYGIVPTYNE